MRSPDNLRKREVVDREELFDITGDSLQTIASYAVLFLTLNAPSKGNCPWGIMSSVARHLALTCSRTSRRQAPKAISAAITAIDQATFNDAKFVGTAIERTTPTPGAGRAVTYATAVKRLSKTDANHDRHGPSLNRSKVGNICQAIDMQIVSATLHKRFNLAFNARRQCIASTRRDETVHMSM